MQGLFEKQQQRNPSHVNVKTGSVFGESQVDAVKVRPASMWDTFGVAHDQSAPVSIFSVPVGSNDPVLNKSKTEEDTSVKTQNRFDFDFRVMSASLVADPALTPNDLREVINRCRLVLVYNQNTVLINEPVWTLLQPAFQNAYAIANTNEAAGNPVTYTMRAVAGIGFSLGVRFSTQHKIVIGKDRPIDCKLYVKNTGANLFESATPGVFKFTLQGEAALPVGA